MNTPKIEEFSALVAKTTPEDNVHLTGPQARELLEELMEVVRITDGLMEKSGNPPAFPFQLNNGRSSKGMTLRDHFAGLAMQALVPSHATHPAIWIASAAEEGKTTVATTAQYAYIMADAMLARRVQP